MHGAEADTRGVIGYTSSLQMHSQDEKMDLQRFKFIRKFVANSVFAKFSRICTEANS